MYSIKTKQRQRKKTTAKSNPANVNEYEEEMNGNEIIRFEPEN